MNISNLSMIFCNIFIRPSNTCVNLLMTTSTIRRKVTHLLIENQAWLFNMELTPFGGKVVVEDLLGLEGENVNMNELYMNHPDFCESIDYENHFKQKPENDALENSFNNNFENSFKVRKSTLNDLMGLDFCTFDSFPAEKSIKEDVKIRETETGNFENNVVLRKKTSQRNVKRMKSFFESQLDRNNTLSIRPSFSLNANDQNSTKLKNEIVSIDDLKKTSIIEQVSRDEENGVVLRPRGIKKYSRKEMLDPRKQDNFSNILSMFDDK